MEKDYTLVPNIPLDTGAITAGAHFLSSDKFDPNRSVMEQLEEFFVSKGYNL